MIKKSLPLAVGLIMSAPTLAQDDTSGFTLEEIVVTAQKREQSLQDVPIAVTAYDSNALKAQGIQEVTDLNKANPSFHINVQQNKVSNSPVRIRGIGTNGTNAAFEGAVGLYVDGVYRSRPGMVLSTFNDVGGIEILRGPQGTLFGKNTSAGAMIITSQAPEHEFSAGGEVTVGNYDKTRGNFYVTGGVTDELALRASIVYDKADGFYENNLTGNNSMNTDTQSIKLQALYEPTEDLSIRTIIDYTEADEKCCYGMSTRLDAPSALDQAVVGPSVAAKGISYFTNGRYTEDRPINQDGKDISRDRGISIDVNYALNENMDLRSITSYREYKNAQSEGDWDFNPYDWGSDYAQSYEFETFTQEFNLTGNTELGDIDVEYVLGLFYSNEDLIHNLSYGTGEDMQVLALGLGGAIENPDAIAVNNLYTLEDEVRAVYGHFTFALSEQINLIAGVRYSEEEKELTLENLIGTDAEYWAYSLANHQVFATLGSGSLSGPEGSEGIDEEEVTYTLGVQYFPTEDTQVYANYSKGYKAGGISMNVNAMGAFNPASPSPTFDPAVYAPEYVDAYEVGIKTNYLEGAGRLNIAVFYSDYQDIQVNSWDGLKFNTGNAETAVTQGIEIENMLALSENLITNVAITYLDDTSFGEVPATFDPEGRMTDRDQAFAPEWAGNIGLMYENNLNDSLEIYGNFNLSYTGKHWVSNDVDVKQSYSLVDLSLGLRSTDGIWDIAFFCQNCGDKEYITNGFTAPFLGTVLQQVDPSAEDVVMINTGAPRTYGVTVTANF
ncbi:TonB-dependent receptor [Maricurvus nonylphenolicus]|uniref:TonB-dependent receptor n=1 Tax=Maricurvus nonylphenolicus TaxID=1008307 RepID=UPI0036F43158